MKKLSLHDLDLKDKRVLLRVDFNVPLSSKGEITDDTRITEVLPTIEYILNSGASLIIMSHLGRPGGEVVPALSLRIVAERLATRLNKRVELAPDCVGPAVEALAQKMTPGDILMLENLRFHPEEEAGDPAFAKTLSHLGDVYVNDAFGTCHRKHASTATIAAEFPGNASMGFLVENEVAFLGQLATNPKRPFMALVGGAKISSKAGVLDSLVEKVDSLFLGGGMMFTFYKTMGLEIGDSIFSEKCVEEALKVIKRCQEKAVKLYLPKDVVVTDGQEVKIVPSTEIKPGWKGMDIGPATIDEWKNVLSSAATVFWNGPMGVVEDPRFAKGTLSLAEILGRLEATTVVGGGDSAGAIANAGLTKNFSHISTGGGAALEFVEFGHLVGIDALSNR